MTEEHIVYGTDLGGEESIFLPERTALWLAAVQTALGGATWGEVRAAMNETVSLDPVEGEDRWWDEPDDLSPRDSDAFDVDDVPGYVDGDYPGNPRSWMEGWVPKSIANRFGEIQTTNFNGDFLYFQGGDVEVIASALAELGFVLERNDDLVRSTMTY